LQGYSGDILIVSLLILCTAITVVRRWIVSGDEWLLFTGGLLSAGAVFVFSLEGDVLQQQY